MHSGNPDRESILALALEGPLRVDAVVVAAPIVSQTLVDVGTRVVAHELE